METIEIIRELMPIMRDAGEGAYYLALLVVLKGYFTALVFGCVIVSVGFLGRSLIFRFSNSIQVADEIARKYNRYHSDQAYSVDCPSTRNKLINWVNELTSKNLSGDE